MKQVLPSLPDTPARRLSLVIGLLLVAAVFLLAIAHEVWDGRSFERAFDLVTGDPPRWAKWAWALALSCIVASAWWDLTGKPISSAYRWVRSWIAGG